MSKSFQVPSSLTLEPNPFEQSFANKSAPNEPSQSPMPQQPLGPGQRLPGVQGLASPAPIIPTGTPQWQAAPPLPVVAPVTPAAFHQTPPQKTEAPTRSRRKTMNHSASRQVTGQDEQKERSIFLERNRIAAVKCRQRKKQWVDDLRTRVEYFQTANEELVSECARLKSGMDQIKQYLYSTQDPRRIPPQIVALLETPLPVPSQVQPVQPAQPSNAPPTAQVPPQARGQQDFQNVVVMVPQQQMMVHNTQS